MSSPLSDDSEVLLATEEEKSDCHLVVDDADSPAPSPSNSPPLKEEQPDTKAANFASSRRRSHEDTSTASEHVDQKSQSAMNEPQANPVKVQGLEKTPELPNHDTASVAAHAIPPPPAAGQMPPPSMRPQRSRQGSRTNPHPEPIAKAAEGPAETSQQRDPSGEDAMSDDVGMCESTTFGEPREQIENFNWQDLEQRYHDKMGQLNAEENDIMVEFDQLCNVSLINPCLLQSLIVDRSTLVSGRKREQPKKLIGPLSGTAPHMVWQDRDH